ncbi:MAG: DNA topology modulation protein FlaR, partial [Finegoldia magna]|nr:DNA topology modulation protein FlaR [Finegoldia magna]
MKISIIGYSASGKSTLAQDISQTYDLPLLHLDQVNHTENWQQRDLDEAINIVENFMKQDDWVIDGNYSKLKKTERLALSDIIIFLNFNRFNCLARAIKRYIKYR